MRGGFVRRPSNYDQMRDQMAHEILRRDLRPAIRRFALRTDAGFLYLRFIGQDYRVSLKTGLPIIIIFIVVIGGIYAGMFTATEGGGIGAFTTVFLALVMGRLSWSIVTSGLNDTGKTISMAFTVLGGAGVFSYFMTMSKIPMILAGVIASMNMPPMAVMFAIIVCMSLLGCFIPAIPLMLICVPIFLPLAALFGWNLIWFGVIINILVTMAGMTPPFGVSLFVAKELADVPLSLVYRSSIPFVLAFFLCLGFCIAFEPLSTWLPAMMR